MSVSGILRWFHSPVRASVAVALTALILAIGIGAYLAIQPKAYDFSQNQTISANSPLRLAFASDMDHASVEQYLMLPEGLEVTREWEGEILVLTPTAKLELEKTYVVTVGARALTKDGVPLGSDLAFTFTVRGAPVVAAQIPPADTSHVPTDASITIVFDRPVVPLTQVQGSSADKRLSGWPVTISPPLKGRWRWLGTTTASFVPEKPLTVATKYTVSVPAGITTVSGETTEKDFSWSFETERPAAVGTEPYNGSSSAGPGTNVSVTFNQAMDLISAKDAIMLTKMPDQQITVAKVKYGTVKENGTAIIDKKTVVIEPAEPLAFGSSYQITVRQGVKGLLGDLGSLSAFTANFSTVGPLEVKSGSYGHGMITVSFTSPVRPSVIKKMIAINPPVEGFSDIDFRGYGYYDSLEEDEDEDEGITHMNFYVDFKPSTTYTLTLKKNLSDVYGQKLDKEYALTFETPALQPNVFLHPNGKSFSIFEKGKPPVYFVNDLNVSVVNVEFGAVSFETFLRLQKAKFTGGGRSNIDAKSVVDGYRLVQLKPKVGKNTWESIPLDLEESFGPMKSGLYLVTAKAPEWVSYNGGPLQEERFFSLTNMAMTLKYSHGNALVWVTDLQTGKPLEGARIKFHANTGSIEASGMTDKDGLFETAMTLKNFKNETYDWQPEFWVTAEKDGDFSFIGSNWNSGVQPYDFDGVYADFRSPDSPAYRLQATVYTERPLYGAGDTVHFKGIARLLGVDGKLTLPEITRTAHVTMQDTNGTQVYGKDLTLSEYGTFNDSFVLSEDAPLGAYSIQVSLIPDADIEGSAYAGFSVLAYRKPEYKVSVTPADKDYGNRDTARIGVSGQYYFGAPMSGAPVHWRLYATSYFFNKFTNGWYSFALEDAWCWRNCDRSTEVVTEGDSVLDAAGNLSIDLPLNIDAKPVSQVMTLEADITDENNQVVSQRGSFVVHKSNVYVGLRSDEYGIPAGDSGEVRVVTVNSDGSMATSTPVTVSLFARTWNVTKQKGVDGEYYYDSEPEDTFIRSQKVVTDSDGKATVSVKLDAGGEYRIVASAKDAAGRESKAGWSMYAWEQTYFNWPRTNNDRVDIVADKPEYKPGDTAKLIVKSPYQGEGVKALVTVERENVMTKRIVDVTSNAMPIEVPITEDLIPTAYVSVVIIKPRLGETFNENGLDTGAPAFKVGYVKLAIDTSSKKLDIQVTTDKQKYVPGDTVRVSFNVKDAKGAPVRAELSLGVVDLSLLDLTGFEMPDLVSHFYAQRGLGVVTSNMLSYLMERFKPGSKGGGGDGEERKRGNFKDTAYWNPSIVTDKNGLATASFTLPDNLTTWQLLALGSTKNTNVGGFATTIVETKHVILRPVRPRFAVVGDKVILGAIVHNFLDEDREFAVKLTGKGFVHDGRDAENIRIAKNAQVKVEFPVTVTEVSTMTMDFSATTERASDRIEESIPVYRFGVEQTNATANVTETQETEVVSLPGKSDAEAGTLTVTVSPTLAQYLPGSLEYLSAYPYGCAEQTISSFVPSIALAQLGSFDQFSHYSSQDLEKHVQVGLQKLFTFQRSDGGFGYFDGSYRSYPYLTAYILHALKMTKDAGYAVDSTVIDRALSYLTSALRNGDLSTYVDAQTRAYGLFVLSEFGRSDIAAVNVAYKTQADLPLFARAHLAMAFQNVDAAQARTKAKTILDQLLSHAKIDARGAHFEEEDNRSSYSMNTDTRTTAIVLQAIVRIDIDHPLLPRIIRGMLASRIDGHWDTTQSTAQAVLAFVEYLKASDELTYNEQVGVEINGVKKFEGTFKSPAMEKKDIVMALSELPRGKEIDVSVGKTGPGKLYYDLVLSYFTTPEIIPPAEEGIGILRETEPLTKDDAKLTVGTTQKVTLTITVPQTRHFVAVESMLPAGFEPIDLRFATSQKEALSNEANDTSPYTSWQQYERNQIWRFSHIEFRDDRIFMFAEELPPGVYRYEYLVRATTPGTFRQRPARVFEMYYPEVFGQTEGTWVTIGK